MSRNRMFQTHPTPVVKWKGKTFTEITTIMQKNDTFNINSRNDILKALPMKHYRKEIASVDVLKCGNSSSKTIGSDFNTPGLSIVRNTDDTIVKGLPNTLHIVTNSYNACNNTCSEPFTNIQRGGVRSLSQQDNAKRRVRSSGQFLNEYDNTNKKKYFSTSKEYLYNRNRLHQQNDFHYNVNTNGYRTNTKSHCENSHVPVSFKPNNAKFSKQGAVDSGTRLLRLKNDTINKIAYI